MSSVQLLDESIDIIKCGATDRGLKTHKSNYMQVYVFSRTGVMTVLQDVR